LDYRTIFSLDDPGMLPTVGPDPTGGFDNAGDFDAFDPSRYYVVSSDNIVTRIDTLTGQALPLGFVLPTDSSYTWNAMATDPTNGDIYLGCSNLQRSDLYKLKFNPTRVEFVANIFRIFSLIGLGFTDEGELFGFDISASSLYRIDKETGIATEIGALGYNSNFGQGMDWNANTGEMYLSAFNAGPFDAELRLVDLQSGATTLLGILGGSMTGRAYYQLAFLAIPDQRFQFANFAPPFNGSIQPGQTENLQLSFFGLSTPDTTYRAKIKLMTNDPANPEISIPITVRTDITSGLDAQNTVMNSFQLFPNYPNPFNPETIIRFSLESTSDVRIRIFNIIGQEVRNMEIGKMEAGLQSATWNGTDARGFRVSSGIYLYQLEVLNADGRLQRSKTRKMLLVQ
ncbi:MAG: FlgD immunoglobulin-like domain containing protein, partial [Calditrichota bacterium]